MMCSLIYVNHQQNSASVMNMKMLKNLLLCKTIVSAWAMARKDMV